MTPIAWWSVQLAAGLLDSEDREIVLGDLAESGESAGQALCHVLGFAVRRQAALWKNWRPWLAAFGVAVPGTLLLMGFSLSLSHGYQLYAWIIGNYRYIDPKILHDTGLTLAPGLSLIACQLFLLTAWSWTGGFVLASLSRRTIWVSAALCSLPCSLFLSRFHHEQVSPLCLFLFLLPALCGVRKALRVARIPFRHALFLAAAITLLAIPTSSRGRWIVNSVLSWPAWYLVAAGKRNIPQGEAQP